ncbi:hypothetical protein D1872_292220 [compost metagenome]
MHGSRRGVALQTAVDDQITVRLRDQRAGRRNIAVVVGLPVQGKDRAMIKNHPRPAKNKVDIPFDVAVIEVLTARMGVQGVLISDKPHIFKNPPFPGDIRGNGLLIFHIRTGLVEGILDR